jgi:hypothetical protein
VSAQYWLPAVWAEEKRIAITDAELIWGSLADVVAYVRLPATPVTELVASVSVLARWRGKLRDALRPFCFC